MLWIKLAGHNLICINATSCLSCSYHDCLPNGGLTGWRDQTDTGNGNHTLMLMICKLDYELQRKSDIEGFLEMRRIQDHVRKKACMLPVLP